MTDDGSRDTDVAAAGTSASGTVGDVVVDVVDGVALAKILDQGGTTYLGVTIAQDATATCPSMVHPGGSTYLRLALTRTDGGTFAAGTYDQDDATVTLGALTDSYGDTCGDLGGAQLGDGPSTITLTEVGETIAGTFSVTMFRTSPTPENTGIVTGSFVAPKCASFGETCEF